LEVGAALKTADKQREKLPGGITGKGFMPGQSGNPGGRPRTAKFSDAVRQLSAELGSKGKTGAEQLAENCFKRALKGSARHAELFLSYAEGRPKQGVELSGLDGAAIRFEGLSEAEMEVRLNELIQKYQQEHRG
jgi:Family of unknown function (DUF5681)